MKLLLACNIAVHGLFSESVEESCSQQLDMARAARTEIANMVGEIALPPKLGLLLSRAEGAEPAIITTRASVEVIRH